MKPNVFVCFDTEDAINPRADDAALRLAQIFGRVGIRAGFFMVGEKARVLRERGRKDVLDALREHEMDYHGNYWFEFPEPALIYGERLAWDEAVEKAFTIETPGLNDVAEICGQFPVATCQHQNNHSLPTTWAMRRSGVRVWNGGLGAPLPEPAWVMDLLVVSRAGHAVSNQTTGGDGYQTDPLKSGAPVPPCDPKAEVRLFQERFDKLLAGKPSHIVCLGHPTRWEMAEWWGWYDWTPQFRRAGAAGAPGPYPRGRWFEPTKPRQRRDAEGAYRYTEECARWLAKRADIRLTSLEECYREREEPKGRWLSRKQIHDVAAMIRRKFDFVKISPTTLSAADALFLLAHYFECVLQTKRRPNDLQIRRTIGPVEPVMQIAAPVKFKRQSYLLAARCVYQYVLDHDRLPHAIRAHSVDCGPGEVLVALARALEKGALPEEITVEPTGGLPECAKMDFFQKATAATCYATPGYKPERIHMMGLQQSWSYRPAVVR